MSTGTITSLGTGSGLDLQGILETRRKADMAILGLKKGKIKTHQATNNQLNVLLKKLLSMKTNALSLSLASNYTTRSVREANKSIVSATALNGAATGTHSVNVKRLASVSSYISQGMASNSSTVYNPTIQESTRGFEKNDIALAKGEKLTIKYGTGDSAKTITVTDTAKGLTPDQLVSAINSNPANKNGKGDPLVKASVYTDKDGKSRIRISSAAKGNAPENMVEVTGSGSGLGFAAPDSKFSFKLGKTGKTFTISVPASTTLKDLAQRINADKNNPGVKASVVNTGDGDMPYRLALEANDTGESQRITILNQPPGFSMSEKNGKGYVMTGDKAISFASPIAINSGNNTIIFREDTGSGYSQNITAKIPEGTYKNQKELAQAVEKALEEASARNGNKKDYQVGIDPDTGKMTINETGTLKGLNIKWKDPGSTAASLLGFSKDAAITPAASSLNALATVNGTSYQRQDNQGLSDIIQGVSLSFHSTGSTTISVSSGTDAIKKEIISFVETYNALMKVIDANDDFDKEKETWGPLAKSHTSRSLKMNLRHLLNTKINSSGKIQGFKDLGVELKRDGTAVLDTEKLDLHLKKNFKDVEKLFRGDGTQKGLADILNKRLEDYALSGGHIKGEISTIEKHITRLEKDYKEGTEKLDKKYETMAKEFAQLDKYLTQVESTMSYIKKMLPSSDDD